MLLADRPRSRIPLDSGLTQEILNRASEKERLFAAMLSLPNSRRAIRQFLGRG
jgi:hypothetical protein